MELWQWFEGVEPVFRRRPESAQPARREGELFGFERRLTGEVHIESKSMHLKHEGMAARFPCRQQSRLGSMNVQVQGWKLAVERLCAAPTFDFREAAQLVVEAARQTAEPQLQQAALQALPSLRAACAKGADPQSREIAQRRFAAIRDVLHALTVPRFGKRERPDRMLSPNERYRRLLGLPLGRRLFGPEISQAYKHAAKTVHPDAGGSNRAFLELSEARDALMKGL